MRQEPPPFSPSWMETADDSMSPGELQESGDSGQSSGDCRAISSFDPPPTLLRGRALLPRMKDRGPICLKLGRQLVLERGKQLPQSRLHGLPPCRIDNSTILTRSIQTIQPVDLCQILLEPLLPALRSPRHPRGSIPGGRRSSLARKENRGSVPGDDLRGGGDRLREGENRVSNGDGRRWAGEKGRWRERIFGGRVRIAGRSGAVHSPPQSLLSATESMRSRWETIDWGRSTIDARPETILSNRALIVSRRERILSATLCLLSHPL